ncbi:SMP-30/gluconolactonase/LRE family protein [Micromonospora sp. DR5-3]|uniref:SMP-30/gluconolactonase/LRE family protein n=1 Tax=unclassified Micromonospora TaxID=2617518 RepID=UPI0011D3571E|nr:MULTISPECIES: SMP-30/gluconolactonase/LRE family protein [unclassified Micromonospora]MCW3816413.1 SMP-30/gluconolactonase/LRE family protein [Micromonospora sp. DR5-3]TYC21531.1 SMP-30/gluconolactonase/LRE family protein [Micromonospora sp. MP36]
MRAQTLTGPVAHHGEGPTWWPDGTLRWVDMLAGDVLSLDGDGRVERRHVGQVAAALRPRAAGGAVVALERGFALCDPDGSLRPLDPLWRDPGVRMNEGSCAPDGSFWCGSMAYDARPGRGTLFRLAPDLSVTPELTAVTISNGLDWSPDGTTAYYVDTPTGRIDMFDWAPETGLTDRRTFVEIPPDEGAPDGLTVDSEGGVWIALWGGSAVRRYTPDRRLDAVVTVAARQVTACALGGPRGDELIITTSREGLRPDEDPLAGCLFQAAVGIPGQAVRPFAG